MKKLSKEAKTHTKMVAELCEKIPAHLVIILAASTLGWSVSIDKSKGENSIVDGIVVGTDKFLAKHGWG